LRTVSDRHRPEWQWRACVLAAVALLIPAVRAHAFYLDDNHDFEVRGRFYSQWAFAAEYSEPQTVPARAPMQLIESRNFMNPEFDAKLTRYVPFSLDDFSFRLALWGFYDGIYNYGTSQYDRAINNLQGRISQGHTRTAAITHTDTLIDPRATYEYQPDPVIGSYKQVPFRFNEMYFNFSKGPLFVRIGRQAISWGESDTVALLDANNPFNQTLAIPGVFQDVDEARIPLFTLRTTYNLFQNWGPISSAYGEGYWVPGSIDTTVSQTPIPTASPYSPPQPDPQALVAGLIPPDIAGPVVHTALGGIRIGLYDHLPSRTMANSRFGFRFGGIVARDYTASIWYYRTFATAGVPVFLPLDLSRAPIVHPGAKGPTQLITSIEHGLENVAGGAVSWFSEKLDGIVRTELEFFLDEPAFIPNQNIPFEAALRAPGLKPLLASLGQKATPGPDHGTVPTANFLRFELGYDRNFFFRTLNPYNSFTWVTAYVGQWNMTETFTGQDFRFGGQQKVTSTGVKSGANTNGLTINTFSKLHTVANDFVDLYPYVSFVQTHLQTDYMHGRITPAITAIIGTDGTYAFPMNVTYRFSDSFLLDLQYVLMGGAFTFPTGYFRDRSQVSFRVTYQMN
jgi:hypothetical protein